MKSVILILPLLLLSSCLVYRGGQKPYLGAAGMDAEKIILPGGAEFHGVNTSTSFSAVLKQVRNMWQSYLVAEGLKFVSGLYYNHQGQLVNQGTALKLEELRNAQSVKLAELRLQELQLAPQP
jgi:hypothetical protein